MAPLVVSLLLAAAQARFPRVRSACGGTDAALRWSLAVTACEHVFGSSVEH